MTTKQTTEAEVTYRGALDLQVCVPSGWSDEEVKSFADRKAPCGTDLGWSIRRAGDDALGGDPERQPCEKRDGFVHIMLDA